MLLNQLGSDFVGRDDSSECTQNEYAQNVIIFKMSTITINLNETLNGQVLDMIFLSSFLLLSRLHYANS